MVGGREDPGADIPSVFTGIFQQLIVDLYFPGWCLSEGECGMIRVGEKRSFL